MDKIWSHKSEMATKSVQPSRSQRLDVNCLGQHQRLLSQAPAKGWGCCLEHHQGQLIAALVQGKLFSPLLFLSPFTLHEKSLTLSPLEGCGFDSQLAPLLHILFAFYNVPIPLFQLARKTHGVTSGFSCKCWNSLFCHWQHLSHTAQLSTNVIKIEHL